MAVSLAFGVMFATAITLILVPVLYVIYEDVKAKVRGTTGAETEEEAEDRGKERPEIHEAA